MKNIEGQKIPSVSFKTRTDYAWQELSSEEIFAAKTVVLFSLPGAFTPTCSAAHLPRYDELAPAFAAEGVDEVICLSVNDGFIMRAWQQDQGIKNVRLLPDGNGEFTKKMGMLVDKEDLGFGFRSWRYSMLVKDGLIIKMFIEADLPGDPFEVSDADTMLRFLNEEAEVPETVAILTRPGCPHCLAAKEQLDRADIQFNEIELGRDIEQTALRGLAGSTTVPQIFIGGKRIGGAVELREYLADIQS